MVESTALEMRRAFTGTVGSNPTLSATPQPAPFGRSKAGVSGQRDHQIELNVAYI